jgi:hypothetical protein
MKTGAVISEMINLTYCEICLENLDDEAFDYRFDFPICFNCVIITEMKPKEESK